LLNNSVERAKVTDDRPIDSAIDRIPPLDDHCVFRARRQIVEEFPVVIKSRSQHLVRIGTQTARLSDILAIPAIEEDQKVDLSGADVMDMAG
jgi:hypothetical protein